MIWHVGGGNKIQIWDDPWIPRACSRRVITPCGGNLLTKVSELLDPSTGKWDMELVNDMFWVEDAKLILQMPSRDKAVDFLAWHFDPKGVFSVKSAYHLGIKLRETKKNRDASPSAPAPVEPRRALLRQRCAGSCRNPAPGGARAAEQSPPRFR